MLCYQFEIVLLLEGIVWESKKFTSLNEFADLSITSLITIAVSNFFAVYSSSFVGFFSYSSLELERPRNKTPFAANE